MSLRLAALLSLSFLFACVVTPGKSTVLENRSLNIPGEGLTLLRIEAEAGWLEVIGDSESNEILVEAEFVGNTYGSDDAENLLEGMELTHEVTGSVAIIKAQTESSAWNRNPSINLTIYAPSNLEVEVDDSSGDLKVRNFNGALRLKDRSGDIVVESAGASVSVDDSSGDMLLTGVAGDIDVEDSSGDIDIRGAEGNARIDDSSGHISVVDVKGSVRVADSSGNISVEDVGGDFEVTEDGGGQINYAGVQGQVSIPENKRK
jgi:DUF4097 and DUF4098 domain-containing protein YvlB